MGYEQLLSIQQQQHDLALQHKEAEMMHMKARMDSMEANRPTDTKHVATVLQTKDEEASLMMAAKHKELELMAGLLQLREQQIEDFRQLCEAQRVEVQQLKRARAGSDAGGATDGLKSLPGGARGGPAHEPASAPESPMGSAAAVQEEHAALQREVRRLRVRMEELEAAVGEQHQRSAGLARALEAKSERVKALEEQVRSLHSPVGTRRDLDGESALGGPSEPPPPLPAAGTALGMRPSPPRLVLPPNQNGYSQRLAQDLDQRQARGFGTARSGEGDLHARSATSLSSARCDSVPSMPLLPQLLEDNHRGHQSGARRELQRGLLTYGSEVGGLHRSTSRTRLSTAASEEICDASLPSGQQTYRSAVHVDWGSSAEQDRPWGGASEAAETGRQSQELLREMRRLRLQMSELERVAGTRATGRRGGTHAAGAKQLCGAPTGRDRLMASASSLGGESSADGNPGAMGAEFAIDVASVDHGHRQASSATSTTALGPAASNGGHAWPWSRHASEGALRSAGSGSSSVAGRSAHSEDHGASEIAAGWEYRAHSSGDPTDAAVATLVNRPGGRYRGWRALLCRLERGVYLCGTRRIHLRADVASEHIEASDDGGKTWCDLEELMRGAEASQHALLERARDAAGLTA